MTSHQETGQQDSLTPADIVDCVEAKIDDEPTLGTLINAAGHRTYGPMLLIPALIALAPTGAIPGIPSACGAILVLVSLQMIAGREQPWIPRRLLNIRLKRSLVEKAVEKGRPPARWLSRQVHERWPVMISRPALIGAGLVIAALAGLMVPLELVPFAVALPAFAVVILALGLSTRDGLVITLGLGAAALAAAAALWLLRTTG